MSFGKILNVHVTLRSLLAVTLNEEFWSNEVIDIVDSSSREQRERYVRMTVSYSAPLLRGD